MRDFFYLYFMKNLVLVFVLLISNFFFSQNKNLEGKWILDKVLYNDGRSLEINHPLYSFFSTYEFKNNYLIIDETRQKVSIDSKQIKSDFRTLNYYFIENYLILNDINDKEKKIFALLKLDDFIKKYPEFTPKEEIRNGKTVKICNEVFRPNFNYEGTFQDFITRNTPQGNSKNDIDLFFKVEYILTKDNRINYIKVIDSKTPIYDTNFISAIKKSEKYYQNLFNEDVLIIKEQQFLKWKNDLTNKDEIKLYEIRSNILQYYNLNKFEDIIEEYKKLQDLKIVENRFNSFFKEIFIKSGVAFLAVNNNVKACECFEKAGGKTNFNVKNYLINFCNK